MSYTQEPVPNKLSTQALIDYGPNATFRRLASISDWIEGIFVRGGHGKLLELSTTVEHVVKESHEWIVTLRKVIDGRNYCWQETFDAVVVASGHYNMPWFPVVEGFLEFNSKFPRAILHSKHFQGGSKFAGKVHLLLPTVECKTNSRPESYCGRSFSLLDRDHSQDFQSCQGSLYASLMEESINAYGWAPFEHPSLSVKRAIQRLDPQTGRIYFTDGSFLDNVDHIIYESGYTFGFPFSSKVQGLIKMCCRRLPVVYQHTWDIEDPTLTFIEGFTFRAYEWQAAAVARFLAGRSKSLPSMSYQLEWERQRGREKRGEKCYYSMRSEY
ncbi:hypothetical protein BKA59DRAFT_509319 [Fusarium tricinctum]|uniref:Uncharacterized protein n=1 Tax=Fusarium tricinctum TaxID=61284 RepID=A0A8K0S184_9HYPO|nr:hypothetical protein BKA59DRAFT_509319 [Fusarium tricinctum]